MIKFREQHQSSLAWVSINHLFQLSESACLLGRFREFNQIQPPNRIFECGHDSLEWPGRCHAKTLDLESSDGHFHASSWHQGPILQSTRLNLRWGTMPSWAGGDSTTSTSSVPRYSRSCPPVPTWWSILVCR